MSRPDKIIVMTDGNRAASRWRDAARLPSIIRAPARHRGCAA